MQKPKEKQHASHPLPRDTPIKMNFIFSNKDLMKLGFKSLFCKNQLYEKCDVWNAFFGCFTFLSDVLNTLSTPNFNFGYTKISLSLN